LSAGKAPQLDLDDSSLGSFEMFGVGIGVEYILQLAEVFDRLKHVLLSELLDEPLLPRRPC
jgi:hypothetical protein